MCVSHRLNTTLSTRENEEFPCVSLLSEYISKWLTNPLLDSAMHQTLYPRLNGFIGMYCFIDELPLNGTMLSSTAMTLDGITLLSVGCPEHRLPAAICEDGRSQLQLYFIYSIYISFSCYNTNVFQQDDDVFMSKYAAIKFTHSSVDCQSASYQLQALTKSSSSHRVRCGQQSMPLLVVERTDS